jgi:prepilin-type N-terminal cleavage/methylation domain-containing protein
MIQSRCRKRGFTLLELLLSLSLIVVATALIGSLMSLYARSFTSKSDEIKQKQLARSLLSMIADDVRSVVLAQPYDQSAMEQMLGGGGGAAAGGASPSGAGSTTTPSALPTETPTTDTSDLTTVTTLPPGIYGSREQLMVDVSRIPRGHEYNVQPATAGFISDVPGDVKTVTYWVQSSSALGVQDSMQQIAGSVDSLSTTGSGLVRRALDRAVMKQAESSGSSSQLMSNGALVAPEVVSLEFAYFDGSQWVYQWDSSQQGLPWLVQITLAMQSSTAALTDPVGAIPLSSLTVNDLETRGIQIYQLEVAIPGAQLQPVPSQSNSAGAMEAVGL